MAHMMKHTKASCGHMFAHFDRKAENISNENLDRTRTHLNYNLATHQQMDQGEFVRKRCSEVRCQNRKDINVMVSWVVTAPKDLPENEQRAFFEASYDFCKKRYGMDNVVSAYVHMDEVTPHMHFAFVPVKHGFKQDKKNPDISTEYRKVSAKEVVNRYDLQSFHEGLQHHVEQVLGHEVSILNEATKEGNRSISELKRETAIDRLHRITSEASKIVSEAHLEAQVIKDSLIPLKAEYEAKKAILEGMTKEVVLSNGVEIKKDLLSRTEYAKVPIDIWRMKNIYENSSEALEYANKRFDEKIEKFQESTSAEHFAQLRGKIKELEKENLKLQKSSQTDKSKLEAKIIHINRWYKNKINSVLKQISSSAKDEFLDQWNKEIEFERHEKEMQKRIAEKNLMCKRTEIER